MVLKHFYTRHSEIVDRRILAMAKGQIDIAKRLIVAERLRSGDHGRDDEFLSLRYLVLVNVLTNLGQSLLGGRVVNLILWPATPDRVFIEPEALDVGCAAYHGAESSIANRRECVLRHVSLFNCPRYSKNWVHIYWERFHV